MYKKYTAHISNNKEEITCTVFSSSEESISEITYVIYPCYVVENFWKDIEKIPNFNHITKINKVKKLIKEYWTKDFRDTFKEQKEKEEVNKILKKMVNDEQQLLENIFSKPKPTISS